MFVFMTMQLPPEVSMPEMKYKTWDSAMQNLERENANLKDQLEKEKKNTRVRFT